MDCTSVLIVEDEPEFLRAYCESVAREPSFRLVGAVTTVGAGMALLQHEIPDVLVVDLGLPDGNGAELIRHAAGRRADCDPLVVTIFGDDAHVIQAIEAGGGMQRRAERIGAALTMASGADGTRLALTHAIEPAG